MALAQRHYTSMVTAKIGLLDISMLLSMWLLVFGASIKNIGYWPAIVFALLNVILVARNTSNGILVMALIFFTPSGALVGLPVGPFVLATVIVGFKYLIKDFLQDSKGFNFNKVTLIAFLYVMYITVSIFYTPNMELALLYYQKYIEGLVVLILLFATVNTRDDLGRLFKWWAIVAGLALLIKLAHVYLGEQTALFKLLKNVDVGSALDLDKRVHIFIEGKSVNRLMWPGEEPNYSSAGMIFPFAIALGLFSAALSWRKIFWILIAGMIGVSVIGTYSRSGFLSIAAVMGLFMLRGHVRAIVPTAIVGGAFLFLISAIPQLHDRIFSIGSEVEGGGSGRYYLWQTAFEMWLKSPILGNGFAAYYYEVSAAHNTYLQVLAETGLIGFVIFVSLIFTSLKTGYKLKTLYPDRKNLDVRFSQVLLIGLIGVSLMINTVTYQDIKLYWIICGACAAMFYVAKREIRAGASFEVNNSSFLQ